ncbi:MAG TPA: sugar phosphate isomerase/epimerase [Planctomycetota bacterium]|jgi:sugar phosphate isomerase/epimerase
MKRLLLVTVFGMALLAGATRAEETAAEKLGWKLAYQCYTFRALSFFETVDIAQKQGVKYLEIYGGQKIKPDSPKGKVMGAGMTEEDITEVKKKLADAGGIKIVAFGVTGADKGNFEFAKKMGIEVITSEAPESSFPEVEKRCVEYGIKVALHNHPKPSHYWDAQTVLAGLTPEIKNIGACADTGHWVRSGLVPVECLKKLEGHIVSLHFKDLAANKQDAPWGTGNSDAKGQLAELKRQNFKGIFSIEYESTTGQTLIDNVGKCVEFFNATAAELSK